MNYAKTPLGTIATNASHTSHYNYYTYAPMHLIGRLASGVDTATVNVQTWADDGSGGVQSGTSESITGTVTRSITTSTAYHFFPKATSTTVTAGQRQTRAMALREPSNEYRYAELIALLNPTIYIRKPLGVEVYSGGITVKAIGGGTIPFTVDEYTTSQGAEVIAIHTTKQI
ncbi:MAG: hypothetical protein LBG52_08155 [Candidatus Peribacteria bacterium]|nr:hypothetical protein [Candidatus Peribacteria bacterium]